MCSPMRQEPSHYGLRYVSKHAEVQEVDDDQVVGKTSYYSPVLKVCTFSPPPLWAHQCPAHPIGTLGYLLNPLSGMHD
jgi:hypothetical protein